MDAEDIAARLTPPFAGRSLALFVDEPPPILDYATKRPGEQPIGSNIIVRLEEDGLTFTIPPGPTGPAAARLVAPMILAAIFLPIGVAFALDKEFRPYGIVIFLCWMAFAMVLAGWALWRFRRDTNPITIAVRSGRLRVEWQSTFRRAVLERSAERVLRGTLLVRPGGWSVRLRVLGNLHLHHAPFWRTVLLQQRSMEELIWLVRSVDHECRRQSTPEPAS